MKILLASLIACASFSTLACTVVFHQEEIDQTAFRLSRASTSSTSDASIRNCITTDGSKIPVVKTSGRSRISRFKEQRVSIRTGSFKSNLSCEFYISENEGYKRLNFQGKVIYQEGIISDSGSTCDGQSYSSTLAVSINGYKDGLWKLDELEDSLK